MAAHEPGRWMVAAVALLTGAAVVWVSLGEIVGTGCVWASGADGVQVERFLREWIGESRGPALTKWDVSAAPHVAQVDLTTDAGDYRIVLTLGAGCWMPPTARLLDPEPSSLSDLAGLQRLNGGRPVKIMPAARVGDAFPMRKDLRALAAGLPVPKQGASRAALISAALIMIAACVGLAMASSGAASVGAARHIAWVLPLVCLAAWPILFVPFDTDAPAQRAAFAAVDVFGDWNHPFLPYVFNRPTTWFSFEPWALRLVPLAFLCAETAFMMLAATRDGGSLAGALAGMWFVCEVRRRHGLWDLGDWDVGGTFLMALLLVLQRRDRIGWRDALVISTLMASGVMSSWLMIVVAGVLVGCLGIEAIRGRIQAGPTVAVGGVFVVLAALAMSVFAVGREQAPLYASSEIVRQMYAETPLGRSFVMALPVALGLVWLARHFDRLGPRFVALCLIAVPSAVYVAQQRSHVNGGYYIGLVTPMLLYTAAVATARVIEAIGDRVAPIGAQGAATAVRVGLVLALAVATIRNVGTGEMGAGAEPLKILAHDSRTDRLPIFTNSPDLGPLLAFERARAGEGPIADVLGPGAGDLPSRLHLLERGTCVPQPAAAGGGFYLVYLDSDEAEARRSCAEHLGSQCRNVAPPTAGSERRNWVLRCDHPSPPPSR